MGMAVWASIGGGRRPAPASALLLGSCITALASPAVAQTLPDDSQTTAQREMAESIQAMCPNLVPLSQAGQLSDRANMLLNTCGSLVFNDGGPFPGFNKDQDELNDSIQSINGEEINATVSEFAEIRGVQVANVGARMEAIRAGLTGPGLSFSGLEIQRDDGTTLALDELGEDYAIIPAQADDTAWIDGLGVFVTGGVKFGNKDTTDTVSGFDFDTIGVTVGADYRLSDTLVVGAAFGYSNYDVDFDTVPGAAADQPVSPAGQELQSDNVLFSVFSTWYPVENFFVDGVATVGGSFYDSKRGVVVTSRNDAVDTINDTANGDFTAIPFGFSGNVGYDFSIGGATITPIGRLEYLAAHVNGFSEDPVDGALELEYDDQYIDSLTLNIGASADYAFSTGFGVLVPSVRAELVNQLLGDPDGVEISYVNDETAGVLSTFTSTPDGIDDTYGIVGVGLTGQFAGGWAAFVDYSTVVELEDYEIHNVSFGLRKSF